MKKNISISIQSKLLVNFFVVSIIPLLAMGYFSLKFFSEPLKQSAITPIENHLISISNHIRQELYNAKEDVLYLSRLPNLSRMLEYYHTASTNEQFALQQEVANDLIELLNKRKKYLYISYIDQAGDEVIRINTQQQGKWKIILGKDLQNKADFDFFRKGSKLNLADVYMSKLFLNEENGVLQKPYTEVIYVSTPIEDITGEKRGIINIALKSESVFKPVSEWQTNKYPDAVNFITNDKGFYIAHSDKKKEWGVRQEKSMKWSILHDFPSNVSAKFLDKVSGSGIIEASNKIVIKLVIYPYLNDKDNFWIIASSVSKLSLFAQINKFKSVLILLLLVTIFTTMILGIFMSSQFIKPIKKLSHGAEIIQKGDLSHRIDIKSRDEIGELADDFNNMTEQLQELYQHLENKVKERTEKLQVTMETLEEKDRQLIDANQIKLDFLTNLSAELRTPLSSVMGYLTLLKNKAYGDLTEKQTDAVNKAKKNLYHTFKWLDGIIRISSLSNAQTENTSLTITDVDIKDSVSLALKSLGYALEEKEIEVKYNFDDGEKTTVLSDKTIIDEIVLSVFNGIVHHPLTRKMSINVDMDHKDKPRTKISFSLIFQDDINADDLYRALKEPFIHSATFFNITNLSTNVAKSLLTVLSGKLDVEYNKKTIILSILL